MTTCYRQFDSGAVWRFGALSFSIFFGLALILLSRPIAQTASDIKVGAVSFADITEIKKGEEKLQQNLNELLRWRDVTLNREERVQELKGGDVNQLLTRLGEPPGYTGQI